MPLLRSLTEIMHGVNSSQMDLFRSNFPKDAASSGEEQATPTTGLAKSSESVPLEKSGPISSNGTKRQPNGKKYDRFSKLSKQTRHSLGKVKIFSAEQLAALTYEELIGLPGVRHTKAAQCRSVLTFNGLRFKGE